MKVGILVRFCSEASEIVIEFILAPVLSSMRDVYIALLRPFETSTEQRGFPVFVRVLFLYLFVWIRLCNVHQGRIYVGSRVFCQVPLCGTRSNRVGHIRDSFVPDDWRELGIFI